MKKLQWLLVCLLICCVAIGAAACGRKDPKPDPSTTPSSGVTATVTPAPTANPTDAPTVNPTDTPTATPTQKPTLAPSPSVNPTEAPTTGPTEEPTIEPTTQPTEVPTVEPSTEPSVEPTTQPTVEPTTEPSVEPTVPPSVYQSKNVATAAERARVTAYVDRIMGDFAKFPVSFSVDGQGYNGFPESAFTVNLKEEANDERTQIKYTITATHNQSGLVFTVTFVHYEKYAAYDYVMYINNPTDHDSPVVSDLLSLRQSFIGENPTLYHTKGDATQFLPLTTPIIGEHSFCPENGRSTQGAFPYYNFTYGDGGMILAVGWAGQWKTTFQSVSTDETQITAGQETFHSYLKAGETVRTPSIAMISYDDKDADRAANLWRRWYVDNIMYRVEDADGNLQLFPPQRVVTGGSGGTEFTQETEQTMKEKITYCRDNGLDITFLWLDAGWYYNIDQTYIGSTPTSWQTVGTWELDLNRFPTKLKDATDYAKANGVKTLMWFEPERFTILTDALKDDGSTIKKEWLINNNFLDLGIDECREWVTNRVLTIIKEGGISLYREDFNIGPLPFWTAKDELNGSDRLGMTENHHIQGHFAYWDAIVDATRMPVDACASGGFRLDLDTMRYAVALHRTDYGYSDALANQCYSLEMYKWFPYFRAATNAANTANKYFLRMGETAFMEVLSINKDGAPDVDFIKDAIEEHKIVSQFNYGDYYQLLPYTRTNTDWMAWELFDETRQEGYAMFFRHSDATSSRKIALKGLDENRTYHVWFEDRGQHRILTGAELMAGIDVLLPAGDTSDILYIMQNYEERGLIPNVTRTALDGVYGGGIEWWDDEYSRFDIRFNRSLRGTTLEAGAGRTEHGITDSNLLPNILINGKSLAGLVAAGNARADYDVENNVLRVYFKRTQVDVSAPITVVLRETMENFEGISLGKPYTFTYDPSLDAWAKSGQEHLPHRDMDYTEFVDEERFDNLEDVSEEGLTGLAYELPWGIKKTQLSTWSYGVPLDGYSSYSVIRLSKDPADQYENGKQSIKVNTELMSKDASYYLDFALNGFEPGIIINLSFRLYTNVEDLSKFKVALMHENNAEGGDLGNYVVTGKAVNGKWTEYTLSFISNPAATNGNNIMKLGFWKYDESATGYFLVDDIHFSRGNVEMEEVSSFNDEETMSTGIIPWRAPYTITETSDKSGFYVWDYPQTETSIYYVENGTDYDGAEGKVIVANLSGADKITKQDDAGYFLYYVLPGLTAGKTYHFTFRAKGIATSDIQLLAMPERNFGSGKTCTVQGYEYACAFKNGEWTDVDIAFIANPGSDGACALRLCIRPNFGKTGKGKLVMDGFKLLRSTLNAAEFGTVADAAPWTVKDGDAAGFRSWSYETGGERIYSFTDENYDGGRGIVGDMEGTTGVNETDGRGYFLNYYMSGLTEGRTYKLRFAYKNMLENAAFNVAGEPNFSSGVNVKLDLPAADIWTEESVTFVAGAAERGLWAVRFAVYPTKGMLGTGKIYLDVIGLEALPDPEPEEPSDFIEDNLKTIPAVAPWEIPDAGTETRLAYWDQNSGIVPEFDSEQTASGKWRSVKVNAAGVKTGNLNLDLYMAGLTTGKQYELSFRYYSTDDFNLTRSFICEANFGPTLTIDNPNHGGEYWVTDSTTEWKQGVIRFTAGDPVKNMWCVRFGFYVVDKTTPAGSFYLDELQVKEVAEDPTPEEPSDFIEDNQTSIPNKSPWDMGADYEGGLSYWWSEVAVAPAGVFSLVTDRTMDGKGKAVKFDTTGTQPANVWYGGFYFDYALRGLTDGKKYVMTYYVYGEDFVFNKISMIYEANMYPNNDSGYKVDALVVTPVNGKWVKVEFTFYGANNANGLTGIRIGFEPGTESAGSGALYLDNFKVEEAPEDPTPEEPSDFIEDNQESVPAAAPWEIPDAGTETRLAYWDQNSGMTPVLDKTNTRTGKFQSIRIDAAGVTANNLNLDLYMAGLTTGKQYELSFWYYSTDDFNLTRSFICEANFGPTLTIDNPNHGGEYWVTDSTTEWKQGVIRFTAGDPVKNMWCVRFGFYYVADTTAAGSFYLDDIMVQEVVKSDFIEDNTETIGSMGGPWELNESSSAGLIYWDQNSGIKPSLDTEQTASGKGKSVKIDASGVTGGNLNLDLYLKDLTEGKTYELTFKYLALDGFNLKASFICEANFGATLTILNPTENGEYVVTDASSEWKEGKILFKANAAERTMWGVRFGFYVVDGTTPAGSFYLDEILVTEVVPSAYAEENQENVPVEAPWAVADGKEGLSAWSLGMTTAPVATIEDASSVIGAEGKKVLKVDCNGSTAANDADAGLFLDYYMQGLENGKNYVMTFRYKAGDDLTLSHLFVVHEPSYVSGGVTTQTISKLSTEWTTVTVNFTANLNDKNGYAVRVGIYPGAEKTASGTIWFDSFTVDAAE